MTKRPSNATLTTIEWVRERLENCERIARANVGAVRQGWLEDAGYFKEILVDLESLRQIREFSDESLRRMREVFDRG